MFTFTVLSSSDFLSTGIPINLSIYKIKYTTASLLHWQQTRSRFRVYMLIETDNSFDGTVWQGLQTMMATRE